MSLHSLATQTIGSAIAAGAGTKINAQYQAHQQARAAARDIASHARDTVSSMAHDSLAHGSLREMYQRQYQQQAQQHANDNRQSHESQHTAVNRHPTLRPEIRLE